MRAVLAISLWLLAVALCPAQEQEKKLSNILERNMKNYREGMSSPLNGKAFEGNGELQIKKSKDEKSSFGGTKKFGASTYTTRSFFGLKNPWFGKKVVKTDEASLWSKSLVANADKKFAVDAASVREFSQSKKSLEDTNHIVEKKTFVAEGKAQGALDQAKPQLTIDEVREILNKNR